MNKITMSLLAGVLLLWSTPVSAENDNLVHNPGFEQYAVQAGNFLSEGEYAEFDEWERQGFGTRLSTDDVFEGTTALRLYSSSATNANQTLTNLTDAYYPAGTTFIFSIHYKAVSLATNGKASIDCYWLAAPGGDSDAIKAHDADKLQRVLSDTVQSEWQTLTIETTRPAKSGSFYICLKATAKATVLFDNISFSAKPSQTPDEPFIVATPTTVPSVEVKIGETKDFQTIHVRQGNVSGTTTFRIGGNDAAHYQLSATEMPADISELDLVVTYAPQSAGTHRASLIFDNANHTTILPDMITLNGTCTDPTAKPEITVAPSEMPDFEALAGQQVTQKLTVTSTNCTDYVYMRVDHIAGEAFTIDGTILPKNGSSEVTVFFKPMEVGTYQSTLTIYSTNAESVVVTLNGLGKEATPETVDWKVDFQWDMSQPLAILDEHFDNAEHNKTLLVDGWQNVAKATARPWWGFDEARTAPARGEEKYAKATAYQYAKDSTDKWEMWLVTPALDYKNTPSQVFTFKVMGEYLPEEGNKALFEIYFIDASDPTKVFFQSFDGLSIPKTSDENNVWVPFQIHLENQANIPDAFFMAFRYASPNGADGVVTYYVDDITRGIAPQGVENIPSSTISTQKMLRDGQIIILRGEKKYSIMGQEVR